MQLQRVLRIAVAAALVLTCSAEVQAREKNSSHERLILGSVIIVLGVCGGGILWVFYVDSRPKTSRTRFVLYSALSFAVGLELALYMQQLLLWWVLPAIIITNCWGMLDAVLRFPVLHNLFGWFTAKQLCLLFVKVVCYTWSFVSIWGGGLWFVAMVLLNILGLPLMYLVALPLDDSTEEQEDAANGVLDEDIAVRLARFAMNAEERHACWQCCRRRSHDAALGLEQLSPTVSGLLCRFVPSYQRLSGIKARQV